MLLPASVLLLALVVATRLACSTHTHVGQDGVWAAGQALLPGQAGSSRVRARVAV
jgi:predicted small secreted protein